MIENEAFTETKKDKIIKAKERIIERELDSLEHVGKKREIPPEMDRILDDICTFTIAIRDSKNDEELNNNIQKLITFLKAERETIKRMNGFEYTLAYNILASRGLINGCFLITDTAPIINPNSRINYSRDDSPEKIVDHIAQKIRYNLFNCKIYRESGCIEPQVFDSNYDSLAGQCFFTTQKVVKLAERMGLVARSYDTQKIIDKENLLEGHGFAIIEIGDKKFIVDCTFRQFFSLAMNSELRQFFSPNKKNISMGEKILLDPKSLELARQILKFGWIEATPENIKLYLDSFVKSGFEYSVEEYLDKLNVDNQMSIQLGDSIGEKRPYTPDMNSLEHSYIIESEPLIIENFSEEEFNSDWDNSTIMDVLAQRERLRISRMIGKDGKPYNIKEDNLRKDCTKSVLSVMEDCREKEIQNKGIFTRDYNYKIGDDEIELPEDKGYYFTIIELKGKLYLIDCTYRQFFSKTFDDENGKQHDPGMYMIKDAKRREVAKRILKHGWIEATPENIKAYMDGFIMASRKDDRETNISGEDYLNAFLKQRDRIDISELIEFARENGNVFDKKEVEKVLFIGRGGRLIDG